MSFKERFDQSEDFHRKRAESELLWTPHARNRFEELLQSEEKWTRVFDYEPVFVRNRDQVTLEQSAGDSVLKEFAWQVCGLPQIERILTVKWDEDKFDVWVILAGYDDEAEDKIAQAEVDLVSNNPNLKIDLMVVPLLGRKEDEVTPHRAEVLYSKRQARQK
jgi:hypothetical protein